MKIKAFLALCLTIITLSACKDDGQVGSLIQPEEDLLHSFSNKVNIKTSSVLIDTTLSKSENLFLGEYTDATFGRTKMEFASQIDSRIDGLTLPNTTVVSALSSYTGIVDTLLKGIDKKYGKIISIEETTDFHVDSAFFYIDYTNDIFGDTTSVQAVSIYALDKTLESGKKFFTSTDISNYCQKKNLLGSTSYQIRNSRRIQIPIDTNYIKQLTEVYTKNSNIKTQEEFNEVFKGIYASHSFNGGGIIKISVAGFSIFYTYEAKIKTTYDGRDTTINSKDIKDKNGSHIKILASNVFLSANKAVTRINIISQPNLKSIFESKISKEDDTYLFTPAGIYTSVKIPYSTIIDSVKKYSKDTTKVMFNSVKLKVWTKNIDWKTEISKTPAYSLLMMHKDSVVSFFYSNKAPNGTNSFYASYDTASHSYSFDLTQAMQKKINGLQSFPEDMVILPTLRTVSDNSGYSYMYLYGQQLWITASILYGENAEDVMKRPRIDIVYTRRE